MAARRNRASAGVAESLDLLDKKVLAVAGSAPAAPDTLAGASASLAGVMNILQGADVRPTTVQLKAIATARAAALTAMTRWAAIKSVDLPAVNAKLAEAGLLPVTTP